MRFEAELFCGPEIRCGQPEPLHQPFNEEEYYSESKLNGFESVTLKSDKYSNTFHNRY